MVALMGLTAAGRDWRHFPACYNYMRTAQQINPIHETLLRVILGFQEGAGLIIT